LLTDNPAVAARFLALLCQRISDRLRGLGEQIAMYSKLVEQQQEQIQRLTSR
jgi:hypothetical protein